MSRSWVHSPWISPTLVSLHSLVLRVGPVLLRVELFYFLGIPCLGAVRELPVLNEHAYVLTWATISKFAYNSIGIKYLPWPMEVFRPLTFPNGHRLMKLTLGLIYMPESCPLKRKYCNGARNSPENISTELVVL